MLSILAQHGDGKQYYDIGDGDFRDVTRAEGSFKTEPNNAGLDGSDPDSPQAIKQVEADARVAYEKYLKGHDDAFLRTPISGAEGNLPPKNPNSTSDITDGETTVIPDRNVIQPNDLKVNPLTDDNAFSTIDLFRNHKQSMSELGDHIPIKGDNAGTVAVLEINGQKTFGVNSSVLVRDADKNLARQWKERMGYNQGQAQAVFHAEAHSLMRAYEKNSNSLPSSLRICPEITSCFLAQVR